MKFEPLSDGLGFHPFSDGLPYAPMSKTPATASKSGAGLSQGTGAVAAGLPGYRPPPPPLPRVPVQAPRVPVVSKPVVSKPAASAPTATAPTIVARQPHAFSHPVARKPAQRPAAAAQTTAKIPAPEAAEARPQLEIAEPNWVYLLKRVLAFLIDSLFNLSLCAGALSLALWKQDLSPDLLFTPGIVLISALFLGFFNWAITAAEEVAFGTSVGKRMFGLALQGGPSAIFLRAFFFLPSLCFGGIGLIWSLFDRRRRCWHDMAVDLQPIEIARL